MNLDKPDVLSLNKFWQPIGWRTPRQALIAMCPMQDEVEQVVALDIVLNPDGSLYHASGMSMDEWMEMPVDGLYLPIGTKSRAIRCPTVIIAAFFGQMPVKEPQLTSASIHRRDGLIDQYTGKKLTRSQATIDHVIPLSRGGKNTWENMVTCEDKLNREKGNRLNEEIGLQLMRKPKRLPSVPVSFLLGSPRHPHHGPFLTQGQQR